jgi:NitT/TauT family transport system substrate-binding protein
MMVYNAPPFAIIGRKSLGVMAPKDLEGKILGAPAPDGAYAQWKAFVKANGIDASKVTIENVGFPVREPMLAAGKVDAITGYSFSSYINLKAKGVGAEDISLILMRDHGLDLYGNVVIVNPDFAKANPDAVKAFVAVTVRGYLETAKDPASAVKHVLNHNDVAREEVELERLQMALAQNIITDEVRANGFGDVDMERLERSIDQIADTYEFTNRPMAGDVFDSQYLPAKADRMAP